MRRLFLLLCLLLAAPAFAQQAAPEPEVIALNAEDAETCKAGCPMITAEALKAIAAKLRRLEQMEEIAEGLAAELKNRPARIYCI